MKPKGAGKYDSEFKPPREGTYLSGNNNKVIRGTLEECKTACIEEKRFFCKSIEYGPRTRCALSKYSKSDTPRIVRLGKNKNY